jgi:hypothetical protein
MARYKHIDTSPRFHCRRSRTATAARQLRTRPELPRRSRARPVRLRRPLQERPDRRRAYPPACCSRSSCSPTAGASSAAATSSAPAASTSPSSRSPATAPRTSPPSPPSSAPWTTRSGRCSSPGPAHLRPQGLIGREMFAIDGVKLPSATPASSQERHPRRLRAPGRQDGSRRPRHARPPPRERRPAGRPDAGREGSPQRIERLNGKPRRCANGSASIPKTARAPRARSSRATAPTTSRQDGHQQGRHPGLHRRRRRR